MLHRLLIAILLACLAIPAVATPVSHGAQVAQNATSDCHTPVQKSGGHVQKHECIGCIARYDGIACSAPLALPAEPQAAVPLSAQLPQTRAGPDTPPPRS
jgi:hypothetical protein